jgi:alpha-D-xyloside xylohydrolase
LKQRVLATAAAIAAAMMVNQAASAQRGSAALTSLDQHGHVRAVVPAEAGEFRYQPVRNGVQFQLNGVTKTVLFYSPAVVRVNAHLGESHWRHPSLAVIRRPDAVRFRIEQGADTLSLVGEQVRVAIDKRTGALSYYDAAGRILTREKADAPQSIEKRAIADAQRPICPGGRTGTISGRMSAIAAARR